MKSPFLAMALSARSSASDAPFVMTKSSLVDSGYFSERASLSLSSPAIVPYLNAL